MNIPRESPIDWGHPVNASLALRARWDMMAKRWEQFVGAIPNPSLDIGGAVKTKYTVTIDPYPRGPVDIKAVGEMLPIQDGYFSSVILQSVLKHVQNPKSVLLEAWRVLRENGMLYVSSPINVIDEHRHNFTSSTLKTLIETTGFKIIRTLGLGFKIRYAERFLIRAGPRVYSLIPVPLTFARVAFIVARKTVVTDGNGGR